MRPTIVKLVAACVAVLLVAGGVLVYRTVAQQRAAADLARAADELATTLASGQPDRAVLPDAPDLAPLLGGTGTAGHRVEVASTRVDGATGTAQLRHLWTLREGDPPVSYETEATFTERAGQWVATWQPGLLAPGLGQGERLRVVRSQPPRADILDGTGAPLVTRRPVARVGIDRGAVSKDVAVASAGALARALSLTEQPYVDAVAGAGDVAFVEAITVRDPSPELTAARRITLPGLLLVPDELPLAPTASFARPILGSVGAATKELVEKSEGRISAGDRTGLGGLQAALDPVLAGRPGQALQVIPAAGGAARVLASVDPVPGRPVRVSIEAATQTAAEGVLAAVKPAAAIVAIRPSDGHVLAAASGPGGQGMSTATLGEYPPGSTMKVVTALALLRSGLTPEATVTCPATLDVSGRTFKNYDGYPAGKLGSISLRTAFAQSCNTALMGQRDRLADGALAEAAAALGMTAEPALGVPAVLGSVPQPAGDTEKAAGLIGQGRVTASPVGMATVAASVAAGHRVSPIVVLDPAGPTGSAAPSGSAAPATPLTAPEASALRSLMRAVVTEGNAGFLQAVPGAEVLAKSGTAEYGDATPPRTHAWMIAIQGDLAVAAFVADAAGGASDAGPLVADFLRRLPTQR